MTLIDGLEANNTAETAGVLVGSTFVRLGNPLPGGITTITTTNAAGTFGVPAQTNLLVDDRITFNLGGGAQTRSFDAAVQDNATITHDTGSTHTGTVSIRQVLIGSTFLSPPTAAGAALTARQANPTTA